MNAVTSVQTIIENAPLAEALPENPHDAIARLSRMPSLEYELVRAEEAKKLGIKRVSVMDAEVKNARQKVPEAIRHTEVFSLVDPWPEPVDGATLLDELYDTVRCFIICTPETARAVALWIAFTWFVDFVQVAPLVVITAPEKRCGKSQLLNFIGCLARRPLVASNISPAAVFRVIEAYSPTLLLDEADSFFKENEELRGVINSGHTRQSAYVIRTVGEDHQPKTFSTWGAKAISGIGKLSETLMDRAVILELRRKLPHENVQRLRHAKPELFIRLSSMLARFAEDCGAAIGGSRPALPEILNDRAQDNWEPLLAIADHAGGEWPQLARDAALKLSGADQEAVSRSAELLADIRNVFIIEGVDRIASVNLLAALIRNEEAPWATYSHGKPMSPRQLAKQLSEYGIRTKNIRLGAYNTPKGFLRCDFDDVFARYLISSGDTPVENAMPPQHEESQGTSVSYTVADHLQCGGYSNASATHKLLQNKDCGVVADKTRGTQNNTVEVTI